MAKRDAPFDPVPPRRGFWKKPLFTLVASSILTVGMIACGGGGAEPSSQTTSGSATSATITPAAPSSSVTLPTAVQLKSALLQVSDLGSPFAVYTPTSSGKATGCAALVKLINGPGRPGQLQQEVDFTGGDTGPFMYESLMTESPAELADDDAQARSALSSCRSITFTDGTRVPFTLSPIHFGGPGSAAVRMDGEINGVELNGYLVIERLGSVELSYVFFQIQSGSSQSAYLYYTQAVRKAQRILGQTPITTQPS